VMSLPAASVTYWACTHTTNQSRQEERVRKVRKVSKVRGKGGRQRISETQTRRGNKNREEGKPLGWSLGGSVASARMYAKATRSKMATVKPWHLHEAWCEKAKKTRKRSGQNGDKTLQPTNVLQYLAACLRSALLHIFFKGGHSSATQLARCTTGAVASPVVLASLLDPLLDRIKASAKTIFAVNGLSLSNRYKSILHTEHTYARKQVQRSVFACDVCDVCCPCVCVCVCHFRSSLVIHTTDRCMTIVEEHCARLRGWTVRSGKLLGAKASAAATATRITEDRTEIIALLSTLLFFSLPQNCISHFYTDLKNIVIILLNFFPWKALEAHDSSWYSFITPTLKPGSALWRH
jgi:hypothetical protein